MKWQAYREFEDGELLAAMGYDIVIHRQTLGTLSLTSGQLVACDLIEHPDTEPFELKVTPGQYMVRGIITEMRDDVAMAYISVELSEHPALYWKVGMVADEDRSIFNDEPKGFMVHSDVGALMDAQAAIEWIHYRQIHNKIESNEIERDLNAQLRKTRKKHKGQTGWAAIEHNALANNSIIAFRCGLQPGLCTTYFGFDEDDQLVRIVVDLNVLKWRFPSFKRLKQKRFIAT